MIHQMNVIVNYTCKVQQKFGSKIDLPQIVVVGAQSSGKSSVLDSLVRLAIFPRGTGTVTTCPTIVQIVQLTNDLDKEGVELEDFPEGGRMENHDMVRAKITELMQRNNGKLVETPIIVRVYSRMLSPFTVIDMPGVTKITGTDGLSEDELKDLSRKYIRDENSIILAVSPANNDIHNSDAIKLAQEVDPEGNRTIGVLTKLDIMEQGTDSRQLLTGTYPGVQVKLGMVGIVNRSTDDINRGVTVEQQLKKEKKFFNKNYPDLANKNGVEYLAKRLHELLVPHIMKCLPDLMKKFENDLYLCTKRLAEIPADLPTDEEIDFLYKMIHRFETNVKTEIEGGHRRPQTRYLYGGVLIKDIFQKNFSDGIVAAEKTAEALTTDESIETAFLNTGTYDSMTVFAEAVFRALSQDQIMELVKPSLNCADQVYDEIIKIADRNLTENGNRDFKYFPVLRTLMKNVVKQTLDSNLDRVKYQLEDYIRVQSNDIFSLDNTVLARIATLTKDLDVKYHTANEAAAKEPPTPDVPAITPGDRLRKVLKDSGSIQLIKDMVKQYFLLIKSHCQDYIPKLIADRLLMPFANNDGTFGIKLRAAVRERQKQGSLTQLPEEVQKERDNDMQLQKDLLEVIAAGKEIHNGYIYEKGAHGEAAFLGRDHQQKKEE